MSPRPIELTRAAYGLVLLLAPRRALEALHRIEVDRTSLAVARALGARQVAQAAMSGLGPSPEVLAMGVWVDVAHGASALTLAAVDRPRASAGLMNLGASLVWAGWGYADLRQGRMTPPEHDRQRDLLARHALALLPLGGRLLARTQRLRASAGNTGQDQSARAGQVNQGIGSAS